MNSENVQIVRAFSRTLLLILVQGPEIISLVLINFYREAGIVLLLYYVDY